MAIPDDIAEALVSAHERMDAQFKRIEQIEKILSEDGVTADGFDKRIRELEGQENALDAAALLELRDRDRQDRWHATRDAFVAGRGPCYARNDAEYAAYTDALHKAAKDFADRAHGPLEIVVPAGTTFDEAALAKGGKFVSQPGWSQWDAKVEALVKAAKRHLCGHTRGHHRNECGCTTCELAGAAEPFETERSE